MSSHVKRARWALLVVAGLVVLVHLWVASWMAETMRPVAPEGIERMSASYQAELRFGEPPQVARAAPPAPPPRAVAPPKQPASPADTVPAPEPVASAASEAAPLPEPKPALEPQPEPEDLAASAATETPPEAVAETASSPPAETPLQAASEPPLLAMAPPSASAPNDGEAFVWPLATRVSYKLFGHYRGPVHGDATVEWLTLDSKYQVHIDATIGPSFAPIGSWRLSSEGELGPDGLTPRRHESVDRVVIRGSRLRSSEFDDDTVRLNDGTTLPRPPKLQDPASLVVQLAYMFITQPELGRAGRTITLPVATTRKLEGLSFEVLGMETVDTGVGSVEALHVKPQRESREKGSLPADMWFAPSLQYLPVKILVKAGDEPTFLQLTLARMPEQTMPAPVPDLRLP